MSMKHRILSLALALLMIAAILPILPVAAESTLPELPATLPGEKITDWGEGGSTPGKKKVDNLGMDPATIGKSYTLKDFIAFADDNCHMTINGSKSTTSTTGMKLKTKKLTGACGIMVLVNKTGNDAGLGMQFAVTVKLTDNGVAESYTYTTANTSQYNTYVYNTSQLASDGVWAGEVNEKGTTRVASNLRIPGKGFSGYLYIPFSSFHCADSRQKDLDEAIALAAASTTLNPVTLEVSNFRCQAAAWTSGAFADVAAIKLVSVYNAITSVQPILTDNIDLAVNASAPATATLAVRVGGGEAQTIAPTVNKDGTLTFRFEGLLPRQLNDEVVMDLTDGGAVIDSRSFTFADYCRQELKNAKNSEVLNTLLVDLLNYGAESQKYAGYRTDALANAALTDSQKKLASADLNAADLTSVKAVSGSGSEIVWKSAFLALRSSVVLYAKFESESNDLTAKVNGKAAEIFKTGENTYTIRYTGIYVNEFGAPLTVTVWNGSTQVGKTLTYSVESYAKLALTNNDFADVRPLVGAFAKYCQSAIAFGGVTGEIRIPAFTGDGYLALAYTKDGAEGFDYNAGHGDWQKTIRDTTADAVNAYRGKLVAEGYILKESNEIGNNRFWTYRSENGKEIIHLNWFPTLDDGNYTLDGELHPDTGVCNIIACQGDEFIPSAEETAYTVKNPTTLIQPSRKAVDVYERGDTTVGGGLSLVFQLADGRYIIVDGGPLQDTAKGDEDTLYKYLSDHAPKGEKPTIALWIGTHPHGDHVWLVTPFLQKYHDKVNLEMIGMNYPDLTEYKKYAQDNENMAFIENFKNAAELYYPDVIFWKMHSGDALRVADALIEVVFTHEDFTSVYGIYTALGIRPGETQDHIQTSNELSTCFRVTIHGETALFMGDLERNGPLPFFNSYNGTDALKVDIFQIPHHVSMGNNYIDKNCCLYHLIDPKIVVYSTGALSFLGRTMISSNNRAANEFLLGALNTESDPWSWSLDAKWHRGEESGVRRAYSGGFEGKDIFLYTFPSEK